MQRSDILVSLFFMAISASLTFDFVSWNFLPPFLPLALADWSPAIVRSRMSSLSNSASVANIPNINLPLAVVVSIFAPFPVNTFNPIFCDVKYWTILIRCFRLLPNLSNLVGSMVILLH